MSFTEDELQSFNTILEQRLGAHRQEMERLLDRHIMEYRRETEQRLYALQQEMGRNITTQLSELQRKVEIALAEQLNTLQAHLTRSISHDREAQLQQSGVEVDQRLERQLQSLEEHVSQHVQQQHSFAYEEFGLMPNGHQMEEIELQTELPWDDLLEIIGKALDERLIVLHEELQHLASMTTTRRQASSAVHEHADLQINTGYRTP